MKGMVVILLGFAWILVFGKAMALEESYYARKKKFSVPTREISIIAAEEGFYPQRISIFKGEKIKIFLTGKDKNPSCLTIPEKDVFMSANKGEITEEHVYFKEAGVYKFHCPTGKIEGRITVLDRPTKEEKIKRKIASEPARSRVWVPREY